MTRFKVPKGMPVDISMQPRTAEQFATAVGSIPKGLKLRLDRSGSTRWFNTTSALDAPEYAVHIPDNVTDAEARRIVKEVLG